MIILKNSKEQAEKKKSETDIVFIFCISWKIVYARLYFKLNNLFYLAPRVRWRGSRLRQLLNVHGNPVLAKVYIRDESRMKT